VTSSYRLAEKAEADLAEIYDYGLDKWGEDAAIRYYYALHERFLFIAEWPFWGRLGINP
jgi:toxin ParE1/3/4